MVAKVDVTNVEYPSVAQIDGFKSTSPKPVAKSGSVFINDCNTLYLTDFSFEQPDGSPSIAASIYLLIL